MQQRSFGKLPSGESLNRIKRSSNFRNSAFQNLQETALIAKDASYVSMITKFFGKGVDREPTAELPSAKTDLKNLSSAPQLVWFGHSSFLISIGGKKILSDPVFSERPSPVQYAGSKSYPGTRVYSVEDFPTLDVIIISHDHYDHLDYGSIRALDEKTSHFVVPLGVGSHLIHWGISKDKITEFDWWEGGEILPGINITCTPARHFSGRGFRRNKTLWASFILNTGGYNIFIGGDSGYDDSFKKIGDSFGPFDIAMLECGQYDVQWPEIHMMPEQTIQASIDLQSKIVLPVHWAKFTLALHPWKDPIERASAEASRLGVTMATPLIGEPIYLGQQPPAKTWWKTIK
jgi:L-ascorbate metabolism protein UlaG (beta-lactamase superfamily)